MDEIRQAAARLLTVERRDIAAVMSNLYLSDFDRLTVLPGWRVRDLIAHTIVLLRRGVSDAGLLAAADGGEDLRDLARRSPGELVMELDQAYDQALSHPHLAGLALPAWIHGGDLRDAVSSPQPYCAPGLPEALRLLVHTSIERRLIPVDVVLTDSLERGLSEAHVCLGDPAAAPQGWLRTDAAGLFRIVAGRRVELVEHDAVGISAQDLVLFR